MPAAEMRTHEEHTVDGPADCRRCQFLRDNAYWMELPPLPRRGLLPNPGGQLDTDALAEAIVRAVTDWAGDDPASLRFAEELLSRTPLLEGSAR
jgi:hypothetical protein